MKLVKTFDQLMLNLDDNFDDAVFLRCRFMSTIKLLSS